MRSIKMIGLTIVAVLAVGAMTASAASAATFVASEKGTTTSTALGTQHFELAEGSGEYVNCTSMSGSGLVEELESTEAEQNVNYSNCTAQTAFGEAESVSISEADYEFNSNGSVAIVKPITITLKVIGITCTINVEAQSNLKEITYTNNGGKVKVDANVHNIHEESCLGSSTTGVYEGESEVELNGGAGEVSVK